MLLGVAIIGSSSSVSHNGFKVFGTSSYQMSFNSSSRLTDHSNKMYTGSNYPISFSYSGTLNTYSDGWQYLNGSIYNTDQIKGITSLNAIFDGDIVISYGYKSNGNIYYIVSETLTSGLTYNFDNSKPSYFKITAANGAYITSMNLVYSCIDNNSVIEGWGTNNMVVTPKVSASTITFGMYPQVRISDSSIISNLESLSPKNNGMYFYNGKYYLDREADPYSSSYRFDDGTTISSGTKYWFECQPIVWDILNSIGNTYKLFSQTNLDSQQFHHTTSAETIDDTKYYSVNYSHSDIREYLNNTFYTRAFSINSNPVNLVTVNNRTTVEGDYYLNTPGLETEDKVYLLSYSELTNEDFGFVDNNSRKRTTSDYTAAVGSTYLGYYFTRTPCGQGQGYGYGDRQIRYVRSTGAITYSAYTNDTYAICPGIAITI